MTAESAAQLVEKIIVRIEVGDTSDVDLPAAHEALRAHLGDLRVELECTPRNALLDVEHLGRSLRPTAGNLGPAFGLHKSASSVVEVHTNHAIVPRQPRGGGQSRR